MGSEMCIRDSTYEIGLGTFISRISWCEVGKQSDVFAGERQRSSHPAYDKQEMEMVLTKTTSFEVVK